MSVSETEFIARLEDVRVTHVAAAVLRAKAEMLGEKLRESFLALVDANHRARLVRAEVESSPHRLGRATDVAELGYKASPKAALAFPPPYAPAAADHFVVGLLKTLGDDDLGEATDALIAAYQAAAAQDEEAADALRGVLLQLGRHLAGQIGPLAAGIRLN